MEQQFNEHDDDLTTNVRKKDRWNRNITGNNINALSSRNDYCYALVEKAVEINYVLDEPEIDLWRLRELALTEGGLVNDAVRRRAWPKLVGLHKELWSTTKQLKGCTKDTATTKATKVSKNSTTFSTRARATKNLHEDHSSSLSSSLVHLNNNNNNTNNIPNGPTLKSPKGRYNGQRKKSKSDMVGLTCLRSTSKGRNNNSLELIEEGSTTTENTTTSIGTIPSNSNSTINNTNNTGGSWGGNNSDHDGSNSSIVSIRDKVIARSMDFLQIEMDCKRCTWHLLTGSQRSQRAQMENKRKSKIAKLIRRKQRRLANLINYTLVKSYNCHDIKNIISDHESSATDTTKATTSNEGNIDPVGRSYSSDFSSKHSIYSNISFQQQHKSILTYYQGYHDVACIILSTLSGSIPMRSSDHLCQQQRSHSHHHYIDNEEHVNGPDSVVIITKDESHTSPPPVARPESYADNIHGGTASDDLATSCGIDVSAAVLFQLSQSHFVDCLKSSFWDLQTILRLTMFPLLNHFDSTVYKHFVNCEMEVPFFALSWVITWFSHEIRDTQLVKRLFDFFIVSHPLMPIYVSIAMILHPINRQEVLNTEIDFSSLHHTLSSLPRNSSMVGWKYSPGDGYVSDDGREEDDDQNHHDDSVSIDADSFVLINEAWATLLHNDSQRNHQKLCNGVGAGCGYSAMPSSGSAMTPEAVSVVSSSLSSAVEMRVPFQELLDMAIRYIEQVPPRLLLRLAAQFYSCYELEHILQPLAQHNCCRVNPTARTISKDPEGVLAAVTSSIRTLHSPHWTRISKCPSDWILLQYQQEEAKRRRRLSSDGSSTGSSPIQILRNRKRLLEKSRSTSSLSDLLLIKNDEFDISKILKSTKNYHDNDTDDKGLEQYLEEKSKLARIAAGFSSDDDMERRKRRRRKILVISLSIAVIVIAVVAGVALHQQLQQQQQQKQTQQHQQQQQQQKQTQQHQQQQQQQQQQQSVERSTKAPKNVIDNDSIYFLGIRYQHNDKAIKSNTDHSGRCDVVDSCKKFEVQSNTITSSNRDSSDSGEKTGISPSNPSAVVVAAALDRTIQLSHRPVSSSSSSIDSLVLRDFAASFDSVVEQRHEREHKSNGNKFIPMGIEEGNAVVILDFNLKNMDSPGIITLQPLHGFNTMIVNSSTDKIDSVGKFRYTNRKHRRDPPQENGLVQNKAKDDPPMNNLVPFMEENHVAGRNGIINQPLVQSINRAMADIKRFKILQNSGIVWDKSSHNEAGKNIYGSSLCKSISTNNDRMLSSSPTQFSHRYGYFEKDFRLNVFLDQVRGELVSSPASLALRNFLRGFVKNPLIRKIGQITRRTSTQISINVRSLLSNGLTNFIYAKVHNNEWNVNIFLQTGTNSAREVHNN